jgi:hypothetical protein
VFLTNKVLKGDSEAILKSHISSRKREYVELYHKLREVVGDVKSVIDLGCGANGYSCGDLLNEFGNIKYIGIEASKQLSDSSNVFFIKKGFTNAKVFSEDLFNVDVVKGMISESVSPRIIFMLQVVDALENVEPNYSKKLLIEMKSCLSSKDFILISNPLRSISGRERFGIQRKWLDEFLKENFHVIDSFELFDEKYILLVK